MIDINELKPIIEPLLNDENSVEVIEKITSIDKPGLTQKDLDDLNASWTKRYRDAFFKGPDNSITGNHDSEEQAYEQAGEEVVEEKTDYEDLFEESEE